MYGVSGSKINSRDLVSKVSEFCVVNFERLPRDTFYLIVIFLYIQRVFIKILITFKCYEHCQPWFWW